MKVIIAGAGDVGFHLAKLLAYEEHEIVLIDRDQEKLKVASNSLDAITIKGNATSFSVLDEADVQDSDLFIAVTQSEETNISTAIIAKNLGAKRTVARIQNTEFLFKKEKLDLSRLGIDEIISPESLAAREINRLLKDTALTDTFMFEQGVLSLIGVNVEENSELTRKTLSQLSEKQDHEFINVAILRENATIIPHGDSQLLPHDHAYFIALPNGVEKVIQLAGKQKVVIKNIMILGGSKVGFHAAKKLSKKFKVKLIEKDKDKAFELADQLPDVMVINGDGRDVELLSEEGIGNVDAFIAVTGNSETNIISCLVAKTTGVKKTISLVENIDYIHLSQNIGVDTMINKKLIAANFIFRYIRKGDVISLASIHGVDAEVVEFMVNENSKIANKIIKNINFPQNAIIGGVIRQGVGYITLGDSYLLPNDRVVVLCKSECIRKVEEFFK